MNRTIRNALTLAATIAASLGVPGPALAGSYVVSACSPTSSPGLWAQTNTFPTVLATGNQCGGPAIGPTDGSHQGALYAEDILNSSTNIPDGSRAGWTLNAPGGTTITAISYYRSLHSFTTSDMISGLFLTDGSPLEQCKIPWPFPSGSSIHCDKVNDQSAVTFTGLNTTSLFFGVMCRLVDNATACISGGAPIHAATADLYSARVTLSESGAPTLGSIAGALWAGGIVSGVAPVTFTASDPSGIQEQQVRSDTGQTLITAPQACDYGNTPPCPQQPAGALNVDTSRVPDGTHTFSLVVTDAAANSQIATSPPVTVDNYGPPPPTLTATAQGAGSNVIALSWRNPPAPPAPISRAMVQLCQTTCPPATRDQRVREPRSSPRPAPACTACGCGCLTRRAVGESTTLRWPPSASPPPTAPSPAPPPRHARRSRPSSPAGGCASAAPSCAAVACASAGAQSAPRARSAPARGSSASASTRSA